MLSSRKTAGLEGAGLPADLMSALKLGGLNRERLGGLVVRVRNLVDTLAGPAPRVAAEDPASNGVGLVDAITDHFMTEASLLGMLTDELNRLDARLGIGQVDQVAAAPPPHAYRG